jgi:hypothetical protein
MDSVEDAPVRDESSGSGYRAFRARTAKGILYRLSPLDDPLRARLTTYVQDGAMDADLRYVRAVFGLVNTSGRKEFDQYWESPWVEEHVRDTARKRKLDAQQRSLAVRAYIRASTAAQEPENVDRFLDTVDKLTEWEDQHGARDLVKTVSRLVQSFEQVALTTLHGLLETPTCDAYRAATRASLVAEDREATACTLRRHPDVFHAFATLVAAELIWAEATNGARNTTIYMCRQLDEKRAGAGMALVRRLAGQPRALAHDVVGMPLMSVNGSMCVTRGVLVVMPGGTSATYVLDLQEGETPEDLTQLKTIQITRVMDEEPERDKKIKSDVTKKKRTEPPA